MATRLAIAGCCGRMGRAIALAALSQPSVQVASAFEVQSHEALGRDYGAVLGQPVAPPVKISADAKQAISQADVLIEFTLPEPTLAHVKLAQELHKPVVIGTTGFTDAQLDALKTASRSIPIVLSPNMSLGVNVLFELAQLAAQRLGLSYQIEVVEAHHKHKKDSPSGTAKKLVEGIAEARKQPASAIPVHAIRAGDIVGDHTVILAGPAERLELTHRAHSREVFAQGAVKAAQFVASQKPGLYTMSHVLRAAS